jgi:hypothetical protein
MKELNKPNALSPTGKLKVDTSKPKSMAQRIAEQQAALRATPSGKPSKIIEVAEHEPIALLLDDSASMMEMAQANSLGTPGPVSYSSKYDYMRSAIETFADQVDYRVTPVSTSQFNAPNFVPATTKVALTMAGDRARPTGGTPMHSSLDSLLQSETKRGIMISDGEANSKDLAIQKARDLAEAGKVVDCIHIGLDRGGEETMKEIAELTGGMYFKFTDVSSFAKNFARLSPRGRKVLEKSTAKELLQLMGATEVRK